MAQEDSFPFDDLAESRDKATLTTTYVTISHLAS